MTRAQQHPSFDDALTKLRRYATVRDRQTDREPRTVTLTDDEALALLLEFDDPENYS